MNKVGIVYEKPQTTNTPYPARFSLRPLFHTLKGVEVEWVLFRAHFERRDAEFGSVFHSTEGGPRGRLPSHLMILRSDFPQIFVCLLSRAAVNSKMGVERNRFLRGMDEGAFGYIAGAGGAGRK